jgi:hypothetical protein
MKHLRGQDGNLHQYRPVICRASMEVNFRWTTTPYRCDNAPDTDINIVRGRGLSLPFLNICLHQA